MSLPGGITLWVRSEPFTYGALPVAPNPRLSFHNIKKLVSYAKTKAKQGYPNLSYSVWKHVACNKLQLPEDLAWMYFVTYDLVRGVTTETDRADVDRRMARCADAQEIELVKNSVAVPTLQFVLFLFIQHLHKINLRSSLVTPTQEWPMRARSPELEGGRTTPTGSKSLDEHSHMTFTLNNLNEILELLVEPDAYITGKISPDASLSFEAVQALDFILAGSADHNRSVRMLHELALLQQCQQQSGFSKISHSFSLRSLASWLRSHIGQNPFGISACISNGRRLSWPLAGDDREGRVDGKRGRIATNALYIPRDQQKGNKIIILSQVCRQTVARSSSTMEHASVKIHRCHHSFLYLLSPLRSVSIEKCRHTTIVLGSVETSIQVNNSEGVTVIAATRQFSISGSSACVLHLLVASRPIILGGNDSLVLAPLHTFYGTMEEHMLRAGLSSLCNLWNKPICLGADHSDNVACWQLMLPKDFYTFTVPFDMPGPTKAIPGGLPSTYLRALQQRERQIEGWQHAVKEAKLSRPQRKQFQSLVESRFQEWLTSMGHKKELDGLVLSGQNRKK